MRVWEQWTFMLKHELYHLIILRKAVTGHGRCDHLGWPTTWGSLGLVIREAGLDETGRELMDALVQLHEAKSIVLRKTHSYGNYFMTFDYDEYPDKDRFFWGEFGVYVTYRGSAYLNELEAKAYAAMRPSAPDKKTKIGFHA